MGSMISSSSEEWEESSMTPPLENEMDVLLAKDRIKNKSEFFHDVLINALTKMVETSPEFLLMKSGGEPGL
jgi:chloramphenicol O-acetyltransferase